MSGRGFSCAGLRVTISQPANKHASEGGTSEGGASVQVKVVQAMKKEGNMHSGVNNYHAHTWWLVFRPEHHQWWFKIARANLMQIFFCESSKLVRSSSIPAQYLLWLYK